MYVAIEFWRQENWITGKVGCEKKSRKTQSRQMSNIIACQKLMIYSIPRICRQHEINRVFTSSSFGPHGVVDRTVGRAYRIKTLELNIGQSVILTVPLLTLVRAL